MSIAKTNCPKLSDLTALLGASTGGTESNKSSKPLCENIFDVQRSELVEEYERLRTAFWSDEVTMSIPTPEPESQEAQPQTPVQPQPPIQPQTPQPPTPKTSQSYKRTYSEPDEDASYQNNEPKPVAKKRVRLNTPQAEEEPSQKKFPTTPTSRKMSPLQSFRSLWPLKQTLIRQIKTAEYNEPQVLSMLTDIYQTKTTEQCRQLAIYLIPVTKAMRRDKIVKALERWC